jgi:translocator protein
MSIDTSPPRGSIMPLIGASRLRRFHPAWRSLAILVAALAATATVAAVGAVIFVFAREPWYDNLHQPSWAPPTWLFAVLATVVPVAVGVAGWRIWVRAPGSIALSLWVVQLGLSLGWTVLFFGLWVPRWALAEAAVLVIVVAATIVAAWPRSRLAAGLLVPHLAWIMGLMTLNATIIALN